MANVHDLGDSVEAGVANLAEGVAGIAEDAIDTLASSFESLFGGGTPAPAPAPPQESNPAPTLDEYVAAQRTADRQRWRSRDGPGRSAGGNSRRRKPGARGLGTRSQALPDGRWCASLAG